MDEHHRSSGGDADRPSLLERRIGAGIVDLTMVSTVTLASIFATATRFAANRRPDGSVLFSTADQQAIVDMQGPLGRGHLVGDTLWAFSTFDVLAVGALTVLGGLLIGAIVPLFTNGRSPGKILFRLRVVSIDGGSPGTTRHLLRTVASLADLMPIVVPGLTGYAFAASNPNHQRIGDRLARTVVVDGRPVPVHPPVDTPEAARHHVAHPRHTTRGERGPSLNRRPEPPDLDGDDASVGATGKSRATTTPAAPTPIDAEPQNNGDTVDMSDRGSASEQPSAQQPSADERIPVEERSNNPYPKPIRRSRETSTGSLADYESLTLPESSLSDMPLTNTALLEALGLSPAEVVSPEKAQEPSAAAPDKRAPIWSEDWEAWIYWDTTLRGWFYHDVESGAWLPMDEDDG